MGRLFICYRRNDTGGEAGRLQQDLRRWFNVYRDVDGVRAGHNFLAELEAASHSAEAILVLVGQRWFESDEKGRRIDLPEDVVRLEIEGALKHKVPMLPILVNGTKMPKVDDLPESIRPLAFVQGIDLRDDIWNEDVRRITEKLFARLRAAS